MKITIDIPQSDIPDRQDIISVDIHFFHGQVCECTYPFEVQSEAEMIKKVEILKEAARKNRENMLEIIREESWKIERVHKEISEYPAPVIPKREALEIINKAMKASKG